MQALYVISAPSGSGKSTLVKVLMREVSELRFSISYTTRQPRGQEKHAESYYFVTREEFKERIANDEFLECAEVFGNYYGTNRAEKQFALDAGSDLVLDIDVQGARQLKSKIPDAVTIFILPPSREILEQRLRARGEDTEETIERRLREAAEEIRNYHLYDYVLVNREVEESAKTLCSIVRAERVRRTRIEEEIRPILKSFESGSARAAE